jgi:hypothetical protein
MDMGPAHTSGRFPATRSAVNKVLWRAVQYQPVAKRIISKVLEPDSWQCGEGEIKPQNARDLKNAEDTRSILPLLPPTTIRPWREFPVA